MGVMPGLIGLLQATEAIKLITGIGECLDGRLLVVDALAMRFRELTLRVDPDRPKVESLIDYRQFCKREAPAMSTISVIELKALLESGATDIALVDVRTPEEAQIASIMGAELIPLASIESGEAMERLYDLSTSKKIFVHCKLGGRSAKAVSLLQKSGIQAVNVSGGIDAWSNEVDSTLPRY